MSDNFNDEEFIEETNKNAEEAMEEILKFFETEEKDK